MTSKTAKHNKSVPESLSGTSIADTCPGSLIPVFWDLMIKDILTSELKNMTYESKNATEICEYAETVNENENEKIRYASDDNSIKKHSGSKYIRKIFPCVYEEKDPIHVDVYSVLEAFNVTDAPVAHAVKKLLCAGLRGKGDKEKDIAEARDAIKRYLEMPKKKRSLNKQ